MSKIRYFMPTLCLSLFPIWTIFNGLSPYIYWDLPTYIVCLTFGSMFIFHNNLRFEFHWENFWNGFMWGGYLTVLATLLELTHTMTKYDGNIWLLAGLFGPGLACIAIAKTNLKFSICKQNHQSTSSQ